MDRTGVGGVCWPGVVSHVCGDARIQRLNQCDSSFHAEHVSQASRYRLGEGSFLSQFLHDWPPHHRGHRRQVRTHKHADGPHRPRSPRHLHHLATFRSHPARPVRLQLRFRARVGIFLMPRAGLHWADLESKRGRRSVWDLLFHRQSGVSD